MTPTRQLNSSSNFVCICKSLCRVLFVCIGVAAAFQSPPAAVAADAAAEKERDALVLTLGTSRPDPINLPSVSRVNLRDARLEPVLAPIDYPWAFEFINETQILLTRHAGQLLHIDLKSGISKVIEGLPDIAVGTGKWACSTLRFTPSLHPIDAFICPTPNLMRDRIVTQY